MQFFQLLLFETFCLQLNKYYFIIYNIKSKYFMLKQSFPGFNLLIDIKKKELPRQSSGWLHLSIQGAWIQSLVRELRSHMLQGMAKNLKIIKTLK